MSAAARTRSHDLAPGFRSGLAVVGLWLAVNIALHRAFFAIYRGMVFETVPRDDYAPYLLYLLGHPEGVLLGAPFGYRILSLIPAVPFYHLLPAIDLTNLPAGPSAAYLKATQAVAAAIYVAMTTAMFLTYFLVRRRIGLDRASALLAALLLHFLFPLVGTAGVDPIGVMVALLLLCFLHDRRVFVPLMLASAFVNEKIFLAFLFVLTARMIRYPDDRERLAVPWLAGAGALALYLAATAAFRLPGRPIDPAGFAEAVATTLTYSLSPRGLVLNILPAALLLAMGIVGWARPLAAGWAPAYLRPTDLSAVAGLFAVGFLMNTKLGLGRTVMYAVPFVVPPFAAAVGRWCHRAPTPDEPVA